MDEMGMLAIIFTLDDVQSTYSVYNIEVLESSTSQFVNTFPSRLSTPLRHIASTQRIQRIRRRRRRQLPLLRPRQGRNPPSRHRQAGPLLGLAPRTTRRAGPARRPLRRRHYHCPRPLLLPLQRRRRAPRTRPRMLLGVRAQKRSPPARDRLGIRNGSTNTTMMRAVMAVLPLQQISAPVGGLVQVLVRAPEAGPPDPTAAGSGAGAALGGGAEPQQRPALVLALPVVGAVVFPVLAEFGREGFGEEEEFDVVAAWGEVFFD